MCCNGNEVYNLNQEHLDLIGKCWYIPLVTLNANKHEADLQLDYGESKKIGSRSAAIFTVNPTEVVMGAQVVVDTKLKRQLNVYPGMMVTKFNDVEMVLDSDDNIAHMEVCGVKVGAHLGMAKVGVNAGYSKDSTHSAGEHKAQFFLCRKVFSLAINPVSITNVPGWTQSVTDETLSHHSQNNFNDNVYGNSLVTKVTYGGILMVEMEKENYAEVKKSFGIEAGVSVGFDGIGANIKGHKDKMSGLEKFKCHVRNYGGRKPKQLNKEGFVNCDAEGLLKIMQTFEADLEKYPHEAFPLQVVATKYSSLPAASKAVFTVDDPVDDGCRDRRCSPSPAPSSSNVTSATATPVPESPADVAPANPSAAVEEPPNRHLSEHMEEPTPPPSPGREPKPAEPAPVVPAPVVVAPAPPRTPSPEPPKEVDLTAAKDGAVALQIASVFAPNTGGWQLEALLDIQTNFGSSKAGGEPASPSHEVCDFAGIRDWLPGVVALMTRPNTVWELELSDVEMTNWQLHVLAGILEGSVYTDTLHRINLSNNFDLCGDGMAALLVAANAIAKRRGASNPLTICAVGVGDCAENSMFQKAVSNKADGVVLEM